MSDRKTGERIEASRRKTEAERHTETDRETGENKMD